MKRTPVIILLLIAAVMLCTAVLFDKCSTAKKHKPDKEQNIKTEKQILEVDKNYQQSNDLIKLHSDSLQKELNQTKQKLQVVKARLQQAEIKIVMLAKKDTTGKSVVIQLNDCDSLKDETVLFASLVDSTRILYENNICQLEDLVATKDSQIVICASSYTQMKNLLEDNLQRERNLTTDLQTAYKQQRKKIIQNKLLAAGFLVLSGFTTTLFINSNK
ncbi:MAG: hypothetical protein H0X46_10400 [Bacteroidetes bacterium]|nr:hypothetical protein [Bacteroidota bacterium]